MPDSRSSGKSPCPIDSMRGPQILSAVNQESRRRTERSVFWRPVLSIVFCRRIASRRQQRGDICIWTDILN